MRPPGTGYSMCVGEIERPPARVLPSVERPFVKRTGISL
jgi:hypothetical protein